MRRAALLGVALVLGGPAAAGQDGGPPGPRIVEWLVCDPPPPQRGRVFYADPVEQRLIDGRFEPPTRGQAEPLGNGAVAHWTPASPDGDGWLSGRALVGGYVLLVVDAPAAGTWVCRALGHTWLWHAGAFRVGDPYANGSVSLPLPLAAGRNHLLFRTGRGRLHVTFEPVERPLAIAPHDRTLPTLDVAAPFDVEAALLCINAAATPVTAGALVLRATAGAAPMVETPVPDLPAHGLRKAGVRMRGTAPSAPGSLYAWVSLHRAGAPAEAPPLHRVRLRLPVVEGTDVRRVTFRSAIDGSVQYYAVRPSATAGADQALVLSLHGAGVEADGQAAAYGPRGWGDVVAATNRRPFGFDWEDWGRLDALEVLAHATAVRRPDPRRIYLTGHSMGGHGTWHVGVLHPDRFAALGPSAGWIAFSTYGGGRGVDASADPVVELLARAATASHTLDFKTNYAALGLYVLHGVDDDNVPADQARRMLAELAPFHQDVRSHFEPGVRHWWDRDAAAPGADCVDWAPLFEFFARRARPNAAEVHHVHFRTPSPGISDACHWARIEQQERCQRPSDVDLRCDPGAARIRGTTGNVARCSFDVTHLAAGAPLAVELDGQDLGAVTRPGPGDGGRVAFARIEGRWAQVAAVLDPAQKHPGRCGPFKAAFMHRFCLVYGTGGTDAERTWARNRARHDAEVFWYRGNGSVDVCADDAFDPAAHLDRSVVCYGNADTNRALAPLLGTAPLALSAGTLRVGDRVLAGDDLALLACVPRAGSATALVAIVGGTGVRAMRATDQCPIFVSGVAYPDVLVFTADLRTRSLGALRGAGYFGNDWSVARGEFAWRER
jgi:dienelactone hydrolase